MGMSLIFVVLCVALGGIAAYALRGPASVPGLGSRLKEAELKRFTPKNTLFIIGPTYAHPPCRLQRRLIKPALAALIREDVKIVEVYGKERPRKNGEDIDWLDASLLRHALDADDGFYVIYVDDDGKTLLRSEAPMVTADILAAIGVDAPMNGGARKTSQVLKKLRAA